MVEDNKRVFKDNDFEFTQADKKIYDKKFETKPIGYFKDAMIRFGKNRTNVFATIILFTIVFSAILVPIFSSKNAEVLEEQLSYLPPRVPIFEHLGIFDGTLFKEEQQVDLTTIDPETGLGIPFNMDMRLIEEGTLTNYYSPCNIREELCEGGTNQIMIDNGSTHASVVSLDKIFYTKADNPVIKIDVVDISQGDNTVLNVYLTYFTDEDVEGDGVIVKVEHASLIGAITSSGLHEIDPFDSLDVSYLGAFIKLELSSDYFRNTVILESVEVYDDTQTEPRVSDSGYFLAIYEKNLLDGGAGNYVRADGVVLMSSFIFKAYDSAFGDAYEIGFSKNLYDELLLEYADECVQFSDPDNVDGWRFSDACPISRVIMQNEPVVVEGEEYFSYELILNYDVYKGYDTIPYYLFGTSSAGKDLFKLIWIGTRTSLLIGVIVASINISIGIVYGAISGYYGGKVDILMQRFAEIVGRVPWLVTLSIFVALIGPGILTLILILIFAGWIGVASITRTQFYRYKGREYVLASRTLGAKDSRLIFRHILPNGIGTIITASILSIPYVIFAEATISYLGFGIGHGQKFNFFGLQFSGVSIGVLLSDGRAELIARPYLTVFPAIIISILMITFNMFGNALRDAFNPALRGSE